MEGILEQQRELYNAALSERIGAYEKAAVKRSYFDQAKALTEWRREDVEARGLPVNLQRATLKRLDEAFNGFFRRVKKGDSPGFPRFKGKGRFRSFGFREFDGITLAGRRLRFRGIPGHFEFIYTGRCLSRWYLRVARSGATLKAGLCRLSSMCPTCQREHRQGAASA
jgi:putative transposase